MILNKDQIVAAKDIKTQDVDVPEWGGAVRLKVMNGRDRDIFEDFMMSKSEDGKKPKLIGLRSKLLSLCIVDELGKPIFSQKDIADLEDKSAIVINRLFDAAQELNGIGQKELEEAEKN